MNNIKKFRGLKGISQKELADKIGVKRCMITYFEQCNGTISVKRAKQICQVLGCSLVDLYGVENFKVKPETDSEKMKVIKMLYESLNNKSLIEDIIEDD